MIPNHTAHNSLPWAWLLDEMGTVSEAGNFSAKELNPALQKSGVSLGDIRILQVDICN